MGSMVKDLGCSDFYAIHYCISQHIILQITKKKKFQYVHN